MDALALQVLVGSRKNFRESLVWKYFSGEATQQQQQQQHNNLVRQCCTGRSGMWQHCC
jgi:hypothetical protein